MRKLKSFPFQINLTMKILMNQLQQWKQTFNLKNKNVKNQKNRKLKLNLARMDLWHGYLVFVEDQLKNRVVV